MQFCAKDLLLQWTIYNGKIRSRLLHRQYFLLLIDSGTHHQKKKNDEQIKLTSRLCITILLNTMTMRMTSDNWKIVISHWFLDIWQSTAFLILMFLPVDTLTLFFSTPFSFIPISTNFSLPFLVYCVSSSLPLSISIRTAHYHHHRHRHHHQYSIQRPYSPGSIWFETFV